MKKFFVSALMFLTFSMAQVAKDGGFSSFGVGVGYRQFGQFNTDGSSIVRNRQMIGMFETSFGYASSFKIELRGAANLGVGSQTGNFMFDKKKEETNGPVTNFWVAELRTGFDLIPSDDHDLYIQTGGGYRFLIDNQRYYNRHQAYTYIPIELEGAVRFNDNKYIEYKIGYNFLLMGNHRSLTSRVGYNNDLVVKQRKGFGISGFIGFGFNEREGYSTYRLVYDYWNIGDSPSATLNGNSNGSKSYYEPRNTTHQIYLMCIYSFS